MPENAIRAFTELNGITFLGRTLYLLPAKVKDTESTLTKGA